MDVTIDALVFRRGPRTVLDIPALKFVPGRVTALVGPNGSGKSTLLRLIAGLERPAAGSVRIATATAGPNRATHEAVAYAFQRAVFLRGTLRKNLDLALQLRGLDPQSRSSRLAEVAEACGISTLLDRDAHRLSGGEAQRANLARTLAARAPVTLLDEPLSGLDASARASLLVDLPALLRQFTATTIVVTHDRDEAMRLADDLVILREGRVVAAGEKSAIFRAPPGIESARFLGYTLIPGEGGVTAIAPAALRAGSGETNFAFESTGMHDLGTHRELTGTIGGVSVTARIEGDSDGAGVTTVSAPRASVIHYSA